MQHLEVSCAVRCIYTSLGAKGIILWGRAKYSVIFFVYRKKCIRVISGVNTLDSCRHIFMEYGVLTVASLYILEMFCFIKKFKGNLKYNSYIHGYNTRDKIDLHTQNCNTALFRKIVVSIGVNLYNRLPERIKTLSDFNSFKNELKLLLLNLFN